MHPRHFSGVTLSIKKATQARPVLVANPPRLRAKYSIVLRVVSGGRGHKKLKGSFSASPVPQRPQPLGISTAS